MFRLKVLISIPPQQELICSTGTHTFTRSDPQSPTGSLGIMYLPEQVLLF